MKLIYKYTFIIILFTAITHSHFAFSIKKNQNDPPNDKKITVDARFNTDSLSIGQHLKYIVTLKYPRNYEAIIPDSAHSFEPFEYIKTLAYPTKSNKTESRDSLVYVLTSFKLDSIQSLSIPIEFVDKNNDNHIINTDTVSLYFKSHLLAHVPLIVDIPPTIDDIHLTVIRDYQGWSIITIIIVIIIFSLGLYFRRPIYVYLTEKRLNKSHQAFINKYESLINNFNNSPKEAEIIITIWKQYLEKLIKKPYTKYTQKDFKRYKSTSTIAPIMQNMENLIYGNKPTDTINSFKRLLFFANEQYEERIIKLKAGKKIA